MEGLIRAKNERVKALLETTLIQFRILQDEFTENLITLIKKEEEEEKEDVVIYSSDEAEEPIARGVNRSRFTGPLEGIRNNLGYEGSNAAARDLFDELIETGMGQIDWNKGPGVRARCCLCNLMRRCPHLLNGHPIATCCARLAEAALAFGQEATSDRPDDQKLDELFQDLQEAHGSKGGEAVKKLKIN